jgi:hypothetical protein
MSPWELSADTGVTAAAAVSPDGSTDGWKLTETTTNNAQHYIYQASKVAPALPSIFTVYAKAAERTRIALELRDQTGNGVIAVYDLAGGKIAVAAAASGATPFTSPSSSIVSVGDGWYRCTLTGIGNAGLNLTTIHLDAGSGTAALSPVYVGVANYGAYIYGASLAEE